MTAPTLTRAEVWWLAARPKTLWAAIAPVLMGTALAVEASGFHLPALLAALGCAVLIQIGTNLSNDYADFVRGADTSERKGPLRVTQAGLIRPETVRRAAAVVFLVAFILGVYLIVRGGWPVLLIGVLSIASGVLYTTGPYALAYMGLADLFVLVFFGPVAVGGTMYVQALRVSPEALIAGFGAGALSVAILLANNIRDIEEDRRAGKKTLVVRRGRSFGVGLYGGCLLLAALMPVLLWIGYGGSGWALAASAAVPFGLPLLGTLGRSRDPGRLNPVLGKTARLLLVYSVLFSIGWNL